MSDNEVLRLRPEEVSDASARLDGLVSRVQKLMAAEAPHLVVSAAGRDEVSQKVASTLNDVHDAFAKSADAGTDQVQGIGAALNAHRDDIVALDNDFVV